MTLGALRSPDPLPLPLTRTSAGRLDAAFWAEECRGRKLAFKLRLIAAALLEDFIKSTPQAVRGRSAQLEVFCRPRGVSS